MYAASEGLDHLLLEREASAGKPGHIADPQLPRLSRGISGRELRRVQWNRRWRWGGDVFMVRMGSRRVARTCC